MLVEWSAVPGAVMYAVYRATTAGTTGGGAVIEIGAAAGTSWLDRDPPPRVSLHYSIAAIDEAGTESTRSTETTHVARRDEPILVVDGDPDDGSEQPYIDCLQRAGVRMALWETALLGMPTALDLIGYGVVVWQTGRRALPAVGPGQLAALHSYVAGGGALLLASRRLLDGTYVHAVDPTTGRVRLDPAVQRLLGIDPPMPPTAATQIGGAAAPWTGIALDLLNRTRAAIDREPFYLVRTTPGIGALEETSGAYPGWFLGIARETGGAMSHRVVFWTFELSDLDVSTSTLSAARDEALHRSLAWLADAPLVRWTRPAAGDVAPTNAVIEVGARRALDPASIAGNVRLEYGGTSVAVTTHYAADANVLRVQPVSLAPGATYTVTLGAGLRDTTGRTLGTPHTFVFSTAAGTLSTPPPAPWPPRIVWEATADGEITLEAETPPTGIGYRWLRRQAGQPYVPLLGAASLQLRVVDRVPVEQVFEYALVAVDVAGNASVPSSPLAALSPDTRAPALAICAPVRGGFFRTRRQTVDLAGTVDDLGATVAVDGIAATVTGHRWRCAGIPLPADGEHLLSVTATDAAGNRMTASVIVDRDTAVDKPRGLHIIQKSPTENRVVWDQSGETDLVNFELERRAQTPGATFAPLATVGAPATAYDDGGLTAGTQYCYRVRAIDDLGNVSVYSDETCQLSGAGYERLQGGCERDDGVTETPIPSTSLQPVPRIGPAFGQFQLRYFENHPVVARELAGPPAMPFPITADFGVWGIQLEHTTGFGGEVRVTVELPPGFTFKPTTQNLVFDPVWGVSAHVPAPHPSPPDWDATRQLHYLRMESQQLIAMSPSSATVEIKMERQYLGNDPQGNPLYGPRSSLSAFRIALDLLVDHGAVIGRGPKLAITVGGTRIEAGMAIFLDPSTEPVLSRLRPADNAEGVVNLVSGDYTFQVDTFEGAGCGINVNGTLYYSSSNALWQYAAAQHARPSDYTTNVAGVGWSHSYATRAIPITSTDWRQGVPTAERIGALVVDPMGRTALWRKVPAAITIDGTTYPAYYAPAFSGWGTMMNPRLVESGTGFVILEETPHQNGFLRMELDADGWLVRIDPHGRLDPLTIARSSDRFVVRDSSGRETTFHHTADHRITQIDDPSGGVWLLGYSGDALVSITEQSTPDMTWAFAYDSATHLVTERKMPHGFAIVAEYDTGPSASNHFFWGALTATQWKDEPGSRRDITYTRDARVTTAIRDRVTITTPSRRNTHHFYLQGGPYITSNLVELFDEDEYDRTRLIARGSERAESPFQLDVVTDAAGVGHGVWHLRGRLIETTEGKYDHDPPHAGTWDAPSRFASHNHWGWHFTYDNPRTAHERLNAVYPPGEWPNDPNAKRVQYLYDGRGRLEQIINTQGHRTVFGYHNAPNAGLPSVEIPCQNAPPMHTTTGPHPYAFVREFDGLGRPIKTRDPEGNITTMTYDAAGRLLQVEGPYHPSGPLERPLTTYEYRGWLRTRMTWRTSGTEMGEERHRYDSRCRLRSIITLAPDGSSAPHVQENEYDDDGNVITTTEPGPTGPLTIRCDYDSRGNVVRITGPEREVQELDYDACDRPIEIRRIADGRTRRYNINRFSARGRPAEVELPSVTQGGVTARPKVLVEYDAVGNATRETYQFGGRDFIVNYQHGPANEVLRVGVPLDAGEELFIHNYSDEVGRPSVMLGAQLANRNLAQSTILAQPTRSGPTRTSYTYTCFDTVATIRDGRNNELIKLEHDQRGFARTMRVPSPARAHTAPSPAAADTVATAMQLDALGMAQRLEDVDGNATVLERDAAGRRTGTTLRDGTVVRNTYSRAGELASTSLELAGGRRATTRFTYDPNGQPGSFHPPGGDAPRTVTHSPHGRVEHTRELGGPGERRIYNGFGELSELLLPSGARTVYERDDLGRATQVTEYDPAGAVARTEHRGYDALGQLARIEDDQHVVAYTLDPVGRVLDKTFTFKTANLTKTLTYHWGEYGNVVRVSDGEGTRIDYDWDNQDNLLALKHRDPGGFETIVELVHDRTGKLTGWQGRTTGSVAYDAAITRDERGRIASLSYASTTRVVFEGEYAYDAMDRRTRASYTHDGTTVRYGYDPRGQLASETWSRQGQVIHAERRAYDLAGNCVRRDRDGLVSRFVPNQLMQVIGGERTELTPVPFTVHADSEQTDFEARRANDGRSLDSAAPREAWRSADVDAEHWLEAELAATTAICAVELAVPTALGGSGELVLERWDHRLAAFVPITDAHVLHATRLAEATYVTREHMMRFVFTVPKLLRRIRLWWARGGSRRYATVNELVLYTTLATPIQRHYSIDGHLVRDGNRTFGYDVSGRMTSVQGPGVHKTWTISPEGLRSSETDHLAGTTTYFLADGDNVFNEYEATPSGARLTRRHVACLGPDMAVAYIDYPAAGPPEARWLVRDERASPAAVVDDRGALVERVVTNAWGEALQASACPYGHAGRMRDPDTGLLYSRARVYDPGTGRFSSPDPTGVAGGLNPYVFANNDPVNHRDPYGTFAQLIWGALIGAGIDTGIQLLLIATNRQRGFNWTSVGTSALLGAASGGLSAFAQVTAANVARGVVVSATTRAIAAGARWTLRAQTAAGVYGLAQMVGALVGGDDSQDQLVVPGWGSEADVGEAVGMLEGAAGSYSPETIGQNRSSVVFNIDVPALVCFTENTWIATADGPRPIESIAVGDRVLASQDGGRERGYARVVRLARGISDRLVAVTLASTAGRELVRCTEDHPWFVPGRGFVAARELAPGTPLESVTGERVEVVDVAAESYTATTYNFEVDGLRTYFVAGSAGGAAVLVHNPSVAPGLAAIARSVREGARHGLWSELRARWLQQAMRPVRNQVCYAAGVAIGVRDGKRQLIKLVSSSTGQLDDALQSRLLPGEVFATGGRHAELNILEYANSQGWRLLSVGVGLPTGHCPRCWRAMTGATLRTDLPQLPMHGVWLTSAIRRSNRSTWGLTPAQHARMLKVLVKAKLPGRVTSVNTFRLRSAFIPGVGHRR